jgi:hemerythrin superfamily protein
MVLNGAARDWRTDMDVTQQLEQDHRKVEELFAQYADGQEQSVLERICDELEVHTTLEEELVYPRLAQLDRPMEEHAHSEHAEAKDLIAQIRAGDPDAATLANQLQQAVKQHVSEEEAQAFPLLRERFADELVPMGEQLAHRKRELRSMGGAA